MAVFSVPFPIPLVCVVVCLIALTFPLPLVSMEPFPFLFAKAAITGESVKINDLLVLLLAAFLCGAAFEKGSTFSGDMCWEA